MNYQKLFYWLTVADNFKTFFLTNIIIFTTITVICSIGSLSGIWAVEPFKTPISNKLLKWTLPICLLFWFLDLFTPSKKEALLIIAGGQTLNFLSKDSSANQIPKELTNFVLVELKQMATEAKVDLNIESQKDKILNEAKSMTSTELLDKMKMDSNFAKIILKQ